MKRIVSVLLVAAMAGAQESGPYLSAGAGRSTYEDDGRLERVGETQVTHLRVEAGAFINRYFSVEFGLNHFNDFHAQTVDDEKLKESFNVFSANALAHYPLYGGRIDLFAKFGAGQVFWQESGAQTHDSSAAVLVYGLGAGVRIWPRWRLNAGYDWHTFAMDTNDTRYDMGLGTAYVEIQVRF